MKKFSVRPRSELGFSVIAGGLVLFFKRLLRVCDAPGPEELVLGVRDGAPRGKTDK